MGNEVIKFQVDPGAVLQEAIKAALKEVNDLTIPFTLIAKDWFKSNRAIFALSGPGKYVDLTEKYKKHKLKAVGFVYPILKRTGILEQSIVDAGDTNSINLILNNRTLLLGTKVPYAGYHQFGTKHLPIRPIIFTDGEQSASNDDFNRSSAWVQIINNYVIQVTAKIGKVTQ